MMTDPTTPAVATAPRIVFCPRCDAMVTVTGRGTADDPIVLPAHTMTLGGVACLTEPAPARTLIGRAAAWPAP